MPSLDGSKPFTSPMPSIHVPNLQHFIGPQIVALAVVPGSRTSHIVVSWELGGNINFAEGFATLARPNADVLDIHSMIWTWDTTLLSAITNSMPKITDLFIRTVSPLDVGSDEKEAFFTFMDGTLRALPCLTTASILQGFRLFPGGVNADDLDWEFDTVRRWGEISPTLTCARLPSETLWARIRGNIWFPGNESSNRDDMLVRVKWFLIKVLTSEELDEDYDLIAYAVAGEDTVLALRQAIDLHGSVPEFILTQKEAGELGMQIVFVE
ncbi:hypothetical protein B0H10DRAFT_269367 [Mycena sp. CBHHK59/15]|nr:hypothetical protein B0H10DRAFT_269367 [Mycena sp. CBHHK59/15]